MSQSKKEIKRQNTIRYRQRKREKGLCTLCPSPARLGGKCCEECLKKESAKRNRWRAAGLCTSCGEPTAVGKKKCISCIEYQINVSRLLKKRVLDHYGQKCNCSCGCTVVKFNHLTIDHVNNNGKEHRKRGLMGRTLYTWIINNNFPSSIQILCWNCNCAKQHYGGCD